MLQTIPTPANMKNDPAYVRPHIEPPLQGRALQIERLLIQYRDLVEAASPTEHSSGDHVPLRPHAPNCLIHTTNPPRCSCHQRSIAELERLLVIMRTYRRSQWWHVTERYIRAPILTRDIPVRRRAKGGKTLLEIQRMRVLHPHPGIRNQKVRLGIKWIAESWSLPTEPMVAQESLAALDG